MRRPPMIELLTAGFVIALWQAIEVIARIQQIVWYQEKFSTSVDPIHAITAGQFATGAFIVGTIVGLIICYIGMRMTDRIKSSRWKTAFLIPLCSTAFFGAVWIALIASPFVDLHAR